MHDDIISACIDASENIPSTRNNNNKLPGWNEFVKRENCVIACDWTGLFEVVSSKKAVVVLLIYLQEAMYNKSVDENTTNQ